MSTPIVSIQNDKEKAAPQEGPRKGRRPRQSVEEAARYFLGNPSGSSARPELGEEAANKNQALIKAFQQAGIVHVVTSFRVEAEIEGGGPVLVMRPLQKQ